MAGYDACLQCFYVKKVNFLKYEQTTTKNMKIIQYAKGPESDSMLLQSMFEKLFCTCPNGVNPT